MTDAYRTSKSIVFSLDMRQVSGIIGGSLALLVVTFGLGVGFGHRLASPTTKAPDVKAPGDHPGEMVYTFQKELTKKDAPPPIAPKPAPWKPEAPKVEAPPPPVKPVAPLGLAGAAPAHPSPSASPSPAVAVVPAAPVVVAAPQAEVVVPKPDTQARFTVQFGAPSKDADAKRLLQQLSAFGYDPFITEADLPGKGHVYRVRNRPLPESRGRRAFPCHRPSGPQPRQCGHGRLLSVGVVPVVRVKCRHVEGGCPFMSHSLHDVSPVLAAVRVDKPWGHEIIWARSARYVGQAPPHPQG